MAVYVDDYRAPYGRMIMCHLLADTIEELHAMADTIGINRRWFQDHGKTPHYDICLSKRDLAIEHGAIVINRRQLVDLMRRIRPLN